MRLLVMAVVVPAALLAGCGSGTSADEPSCTAPVLTASPEKVAPGGRVHLAGDDFWTSCPAPSDPATASPQPMGDLTLVLDEGTKSWVLARSVEPHGSHATLSHTVTIPKDAKPGRADIVVQAQNVATTVTVR
jgi:hypothetical protein